LRLKSLVGSNDRLDRERDHHLSEANMLSAAIWLFILAVIAAILGFGGIAGTMAGLAKIAFVVFLVLAIVGFFLGRRPA
jgi:uncharacterized membrane protein YtjA (UPF0391 family)